MAKIKSVSNYNGTSWDTPIPLGADDINIDITSATTDPTTDTTATAAGLIAADVVAGEGDTGATAWTKFNKFRRRVYNAFNGVAGVTVATSLVSSGGNSKVYSAGYINNYMTNVVGHSGATVPANGSIMDQLKTSFNFTNLTALTPNPTTASYDLNTVTEIGNYRGSADYTYSNGPITKKIAFTLRVIQSTGVLNSPYKWQIWITAYNNVSNSSNWIFMRYTTDNGATWGLWRRIVFAHDLENYIAKSGDTMTGDLSFNNNKRNVFKTTQIMGIAPTKTQFASQTDFVDANNVTYAMARGRFGSDGNVGYQIGATRDENLNNFLGISIDNDGNRQILFSEAAPWRKALGIGTSTGAFPIQINQGGTGQTATSIVNTISNIATATSKFKINSANYAQWGKIAQINITFECTTAVTSASNGVGLGTMVAGKRSAIQETILDSNGNHITFNTNGDLVAWRTFAVGNTAIVRGIYILA